MLCFSLNYYNNRHLWFLFVKYVRDEIIIIKKQSDDETLTLLVLIHMKALEKQGDTLNWGRKKGIAKHWKIS